MITQFYHKSIAGLARVFRALSNRNYRLFFFGQGISLIGTWMQTISIGWLVYRLTHSPFLLGMVGFAGQIPMVFLTPFAGVLSDRWQRRRVLLATQILAMLQAFILAFLTLTGLIRIWHLMALAVFLGLVNSFDMPTRQAFTLEMVNRKEDLANAIALNSSLFNVSRLIGPTIAGILIALVGEGTCFLINAISYTAVIFALLAMRLAPATAPTYEKNILHGLHVGVRYAFGFMPIRNILLLLSLVSLVGMPYTVLMPVFAKDILHGGPDTLGILMASTGVGALVGAVYLAARKSILGLGARIPFAAACFALSLIGFSFSRHFALSLVLLAFAGFGMMVSLAASNTILQTIADEDKRGRLMSFYVLAFAGMAPFGCLLAGTFSTRIGAPATLALGGILCLLGSGLFAWKLRQLRLLVRPIYQQKGILPSVAKGLATASELSSAPRES
ncbi:MFS transporter [candidate division FCPU426 bacterium]|nr:MFS transporter [candidate division FCPU426 bacterium]